MSGDHLTVHKECFGCLLWPCIYVVQWHSLTAEVACFSLLFLYITSLGEGLCWSID